MFWTLQNYNPIASKWVKGDECIVNEG